MVRKNIIPILVLVLSFSGIIYSCDDNENEIVCIDLGHYAAWHHSSTPKNFPESNLNNKLEYNFNRSKIAWYRVDSLFQEKTSRTPAHLTNSDFSNHLTRKITRAEISDENTTEAVYTLNIAFYPQVKGPYNYDTYNSDYSAGINSRGRLISPSTRWGGIQRENYASQALYCHIEFWLMDPFKEFENVSGSLYLNFGEISEDILKDHRLSNEANIPIRSYDENQKDTTAWGIVGEETSKYYAFLSGYPADRMKQDVGLDGLDDIQESSFFSSYLEKVSELCDYRTFEIAKSDPSNDNYHYYRGTDFDNMQLSVEDRYLDFNNLDGNSPSDEQNPESYLTAGTYLPSCEDFNRNNQLDTIDNYYEYKIAIEKDMFEVGRNFINDKKVTEVKLEDGTRDDITWYHFIIPIESYSTIESKKGIVSSFGFFRVYLTNFESDIILRIADLHACAYRQ